MPYPKLSAVLNNCPLHALTPEIKDEFLKFRDNVGYDNKHNADYLLLKDKFAAFYGFNPAEFSWKKFADVLEAYNAFDTQIIMGPVLRLFMQDKMRTSDLVNFLVDISPEEHIKNHTEINPENARYESLAPDELFTHVGQYLGLSLQYTPQDEPSVSILSHDSVAQVNIFHQGGIDGAQAGGHWERTPKGEGSIDYQNQDDTQLNHFLPLLGQEAVVNSYGFDLLKNHVQLTARSIEEKKDFYDEFAELHSSADQIAQYRFNITSVPGNFALSLLGSDLTVDTVRFISEYKFPEVPANLIYEQWIKADAGRKPKLSDNEQVIVNRLTMPAINAIPKVKTASAATSKPSEAESTTPLTHAQIEFIGREKQDSRLFNTWYDNEDVVRLVWAIHQSIPEVQRRQFMEPYVFFDSLEQHNIDEEIAICIAQLSEATDKRYYPFVIKPELAGAHYYAGIIRKDMVKGYPKFTTFLFNPTGAPEHVVQKLQLLSPFILGGESLALSSHAVQTQAKDKGGLVSCGPLCVELIDYALRHPEWIDNLDERFRLPPLLQKIKDSQAEEYEKLILELREQHFQALANVGDGQLDAIFKKHRVTGKFITKKLAERVRLEPRYDDDLYDLEDDGDLVGEEDEDVLSASSGEESEPVAPESLGEVEAQQSVTTDLPQPLIAEAEPKEEDIEEAQHASSSTSDVGSNPVSHVPSDKADEQISVIADLPQPIPTPVAQQEKHDLSSGSEEESDPVSQIPSDEADSQQSAVTVLPEPVSTPLAQQEEEDESNPLPHESSDEADEQQSVVTVLPQPVPTLVAQQEEHVLSSSSEDESNPVPPVPSDEAEEQQSVVAVLPQPVPTPVAQQEEHILSSSSDNDEESTPVPPMPSDESDVEQSVVAALPQSGAEQEEDVSSSSSEEQSNPVPLASPTRPPVTREPTQRERAITQAERNFERQLRALDRKIEDLHVRRTKAEAYDIKKYRVLDEAHSAAWNLKRDLSAAGATYFGNPTKEGYRTFENSCDGYLKTAHKKLDQHRGWSEFLVNLAIGILTAGLGLLIKGGINLANKHSFFHVHKTESAEILDNIEETVKGAGKIAPSA